MGIPHEPKFSKCRNCRAPYIKRSMAHKACSPDCALVLAQAKRIKAEKRADREKKAALKPLSKWLAEAQSVFNAYIRERDKHLPCISCGRFHQGSWDAGHYRSVGAAKQLRFNEDNVHRQCVPCNHNKSGNAIEYRIGLVARIGVERVEALECDNSIAKYTVEDAKRIITAYRTKIKALKTEIGGAHDYPR